MNAATASAGKSVTPFDHNRLDRLMEEAGLDVIIATSKHNVRYLLGGYSFLFFSAIEAIGHSRYLPVVIYERGRPENAAYVGNSLEAGEHENAPFWTPATHLSCWGTLDAAARAAEHLVGIGRADARLGIEPGFLPSDAYIQLRKALPEARVFDATTTFERMRALKTPAELEHLRTASELITESMLATIGAAQEGSSKTDIIDRLRREETDRGLQFDYCLITLGASHNRAASAQSWAPGEVLSLDSGGSYKGYVGDLCRMAVLGEVDAQLEDLLAEVEAIQQAAFGKVRAGAPGVDMLAAGETALQASPSAAFTCFVAHGMGLIPHEVPFLMTNGSVGYEGIDAERPLEENMVISVETTMRHPERGFIKLEDTLAVTGSGYEMFGDTGRGWNRGGTA